MPKMTLAERIDVTLNGQMMSFYELATKLYPDGKSWRYQANGGPPGCFMALSAALRRGGFKEVWREPGAGRRLVLPRR